MIAGYLFWLHPRKKFHGQMAFSYLVIYGTFRFIVEFFRGDPRGSVQILSYTLSTSQAVGLVVVPVGVVLYILFSRKTIVQSE